MKRKIIPLILIPFLAACTPEPEPQKGTPNEAVARIEEASGSNVTGTVRMLQQEGYVLINVRLNGLNPGQKHGIHIHKLGDITEEDGTSTGGHYNPEGVEHGLPPHPRHAGDIGNVKADEEGRVDETITSSKFSLSGKNPVIGRAVILHQGEDDGGQPTGNAGPRIGKGVIGISKVEG